MSIRARVWAFGARAATIPSPPGTGRSGEQLIRIAGSRADPRSESRHSPSRIPTRSHYALWYRRRAQVGEDELPLELGEFYAGSRIRTSETFPSTHSGE